jgi:hypothetical protein
MLRLFAALVLLLGAHVAHGQCVEPRDGWVLLKYLPSTTEGVTGYRFQAGRVPGVYTETRGVDQPTSNEYCFEGLANTGSWYFVALAVKDGLGVDHSNIACFTMTGAQCVPGPYQSDVTAITFTDAGAVPPPPPPPTPKADVTADLVFWSAQFNYTAQVSGTGLQALCFEIQGGGVFDDMRLAGNVNVPTAPALGVNNDALAHAAPCLTSFTLPLNTAGDVDGTVTGVSVRINGTLYALSSVGGSATTFPWAFSRRIVQ